MQKQLRIDMDALKIMADANKYGMAIDDALAASLKFQSEWALQIKRTAKPVIPEQGFAPQLLKAICPEMVSWTARSYVRGERETASACTLHGQGRCRICARSEP